MTWQSCCLILIFFLIKFNSITHTHTNKWWSSHDGNHHHHHGNGDCYLPWMTDKSNNVIALTIGHIFVETFHRNHNSNIKNNNNLKFANLSSVRFIIINGQSLTSFYLYINQSINLKTTFFEERTREEKLNFSLFFIMSEVLSFFSFFLFSMDLDDLWCI